MASIRKAVILQIEHNGDFHVRLLTVMTRSKYRRNAIFFSAFRDQKYFFPYRPTLFFHRGYCTANRYIFNDGLMRS